MPYVRGWSGVHDGDRPLHACAVVIVAVVFPFTGLGKAVVAFWHNGLLEQLISPEQQRKYDATSQGNLKAIFTALMLYHDSEGQFPKDAWMDAIQNYLRTTDMTPEEAAKKLVRPDLAPPKAGVYGYSINDGVVGKYKGDIKDSNTILVFESNATDRNAHGDPSTAKGRLAVRISGVVARIK